MKGANILCFVRAKLHQWYKNYLPKTGYQCRNRAAITPKQCKLESCNSRESWRLKVCITEVKTIISLVAFILEASVIFVLTRQYPFAAIQRAFPGIHSSDIHTYIPRNCEHHIERKWKARTFESWFSSVLCIDKTIDSLMQTSWEWQLQ